MENNDKIKIIDNTRVGPLQKCPYNKSMLLWVFRSCIMVLGTVGLIFFNMWVAVAYLIYSVVFTFWATPVKHCKYCYYNVRETVIDKKTGKTIAVLLPKEKWVESYLKKHIVCAKKWYPPQNILLWLIPIVLIIISFFLNFSIIALSSLIGFIVLLAIMLQYTRWKICPTCVIVKECHSSF
jgi:membrane protein YdbS with pleckstrin-like domain